MGDWNRVADFAVCGVGSADRGNPIALSRDVMLRSLGGYGVQDGAGGYTYEGFDARVLNLVADPATVSALYASLKAAGISTAAPEFDDSFSHPDDPHRLLYKISLQGIYTTRVREFTEMPREGRSTLLEYLVQMRAVRWCDALEATSNYVLAIDDVQSVLLAVQWQLDNRPEDVPTAFERRDQPAWGTSFREIAERSESQAVKG